MAQSLIMPHVIFWKTTFSKIVSILGLCGTKRGLDDVDWYYF